MKNTTSSNTSSAIGISSKESVVRAVKSTRSKPQFILAADDSFFETRVFSNPIGTYPAIEFLYEVQPHLVIREREALEKDPTYRQILPYTVITQMVDGVEKIIPYVRTSAGNEAKLHNKASVGFGGHVDLSSVVFTEDSVVDLYETLIKSCTIELNQELRVVGSTQRVSECGTLEMSDVFIVSDNGVDEVHVAILMHFRLNEGVQVEANEPDHVVSHPQTSQEILTRTGADAAQPWDLENWSRLYLEYVLNGNSKTAEPLDRVVMTVRDLGDITIELDRKKAPKTVENFLSYVKSGHYDGTIFHRVINSFMIQGGGFDPDMRQKPTGQPIANEAKNGLKNDPYTIAMARTVDPNSATAQFFINVADNAFLNHKSETQHGWGYAVFGKVVAGHEVVDQIKGVKTSRKGFHDDVPREPVVIDKVVIV